MKKFYISILSLALCTSPYFAYAKQISKEEILSQLKDKVSISDIGSLSNLSLPELLNKLGLCINGGTLLPTPDVEQTPDTDTAPDTEEAPDFTPEEKPDADKSFELQVLELINEERTIRGLSPLSFDESLAKVSEAHSEDMAKRGYFSHNTPEGLTPFDRMKNAGISYNTAGENIAAGQDTPEAVVEAWMNSDGHRKNILNANYKRTGIGCFYGGSYGIYWTQLFAG